MGKDRKRIRAEFDTQAGSSRRKDNNFGRLESTQFNMRKGFHIRLSKYEIKVVEENKPTTLIHAFLKFHDHTLVCGHRIINLLKKEIVDEGKAKMADELAKLKKKYEAY